MSEKPKVAFLLRPVSRWHQIGGERGGAISGTPLVFHEPNPVYTGHSQYASSAPAPKGYQASPMLPLNLSFSYQHGPLVWVLSR